MSEQENTIETVAIIGMDGRFPGSPDIGSYWSNLLAGRETIDRFAADEIDASVPDELRNAPGYVRARGRMPEADRFDAAFFGISPREAQVLDPQQRVFLEMCWRALEDAGYAAGTHDAMTGVFGGMSNNTYFNAHVAANPDVLSSFGDLAAMVANEKDYLTTRVAYKLDLRGPCINISTACSTSLVAVCHAFNSLLEYQCDLALAGGVAISCPQERGYLYQEGSIHAPDGHCRPFDADARGTVFSNGGGVIVMKRLGDALRDGDTVHAVIRGAAMNNDGAGKVSFTAPGVAGQSQVIGLAQEVAGVEPDSIGYVEAHGTGTTLGDPIELAALTQAFRERTDRRNFCGIGSVKGNIGHLDAASGVAGLIKAVLALREGKLPPTLHFKRANPALELEQSPFRVIDTLSDWPDENTPRRAAVSSFGLGGTNAHVILEQAPAAPATDTARASQLLVLSARTPSALDNAREALAQHLESHPDTNLADAAFTLQLGRRAFEHRLAVTARNREEAADALARNDPSRLRRGKSGEEPQAVFMFPGQGSQRLGMARRLYEEEPVVRDIIDTCADALHEVLEFDLRDVMFGRIDNAGELLDETRYTQPALFAVEYALASLWMKWGVQPRTLLGHSIGEFAAAALAGVFRLDDAVRVVAERARLMQDQDEGSMLSVRLSVEALEPYLQPELSLAGVNAPQLSVVSGADPAIARLRHRLEKAEIGCSVLRTSHAFHSAMMDDAAARFENWLGDIEMFPPRIAIVSTLTGERLDAEQATSARYWARQLREPVRFMDALRTARRGLSGPAVFLEVGPGHAASTFASQTFVDDDNDTEVISSFGRQGVRDDDSFALLTTAGRLWTSGVRLDWSELHSGEKRRRIPLPTYRFERTRYWLDTAPASTAPKVRRSNTHEAQRDGNAGQGNAGRSAQRPAREQLLELLCSISGIPAEKIGEDSTFAALGLDSLLLTQFSQALRKQFGLELKFRQLLVEYNNLSALLALLEKSGSARATTPVTSAARKNRTSRSDTRGEREKARAALSSRQQRYVDDLCRRYTWRTSGSKAFVRTHRSHLADPRTVSGFDPVLKEMVYPVVVETSSGSRLQDVDGNSYIDLVNGFGANLLGHSPACVNEALRRQLKLGYASGPQTPLAGRVARLMQSLTGSERITFCSTGSEAVQAAIRVARTATGRDRIVMFDRDFHGIFDEVLARRGADGQVRPGAPGIPESLLQNVEVLRQGERESIERIRELGDSVAAVLVEPVQDLHPENFSADFLRELRRVTADNGSALIFDEMVTGFRVHPGGMQARLGIKPDLCVYAKICGGGLPLGILGGRRQFMDALDGGDWQYGDDSAPQEEVTFFAGTHIRHPLALAAAEATLLHLQEAGESLQADLAARTAKLVRELEAHCERTSAPIRIRTFSSWFAIDIAPSVPCSGLLFHRLRAGGIHAWEGRLCFLSTAHTEADLAQVSRVFGEAVDELRDAGFFDKAEREAPRQQASRATGTNGAEPPQAGARLGRRPDGQPGWFIPDPDNPGRYRELRSR